MNKRFAILLGILIASRLLAEDSAQRYADLGRLIITNFASAPFPHPLRAQGHTYQDQLFSAADHYQDSHVALFIPKDFRPGRTWASENNFAICALNARKTRKYQVVGDPFIKK